MKRLIIVEDEKMIRQGINVMIKRSNVPIGEIIECRNGLEALEVVNSQKVDVVVTDIRMPKMDGITLVKELAKLEKMPKVIVISGYDDFSYAVELLRNGAREYLLKPVEREKLVAALEKLEEEIIEEEMEEQVDRDRKKFLFNKHLKIYLNEPTEENLEILKVDNIEWLETVSYVIYCSNHQGREYFESPSTIYLEDIGGQDFWIVTDDKEKEQLEAFLEGACYGMSNMHRGIQELEEAYLGAIKERKLAFFMNKVHKDTKIDLNETKQQEAISIVNRMTQLIGTERFEEATKLIGILQCKVERSEMSYIVFEDMIEQLLVQIRETYKQVLNLENDTHMFLEDIYAYSNIEDYVEAFNEFLRNLHYKISDGLEDYKNKQKMQQAIEYIQKNYNKDLNMAVVSNYVSMNYSLFSLVFKEYTGMSFVNYVKELRVNEAKRLLINTDKKVNEISALIGYENEKHFMKVFKTLYGVSPSEYRRNAQVGNSATK